METALLVLLLLIVWINLHNKINASQSTIDALRKDMASLKKHLGLPQEEKKTAVKKPVIKETPKVVAEIKKTEEPLKPVAVSVQPKPQKPKKERTPVNYEKYIGENLFGKIGILVLVIGMGFFVKYAIDNNWINEVLRTALGFVVGGILLGIAFLLRTKYRAFSSVLAGGGFAIFYVTVAIAYHYYELFSQTGAFIILVVLTILMAVLAVWYDRRELAVVALVGGFVAPFLVSSGSGNYIVLFTYLLILDLGMFGLSIYKKWGELPLACFGLTWLVFALYMYQSVNMATIGNVRLIHLQIFAALFYLIFQGSVAPIIHINKQRINQLLLAVIILNSFIFTYLALTLHWNMQYVENYGGAITFFVALVNIITFFWIYKRGERFPVLLQTFLWLALTFVSITFPIQLEGSLITVFWASELIIVMLLYTRFRLRAYEFFGVVLFVLTLISYSMDIEKAFEWGASPQNHIFLNGGFLTGILVGASFLVSAWLLERNKDVVSTNVWLKYSPHNAIGLISGAIVLYCAFSIDFYLYIDEGIFAQTLMRVFTVAVLFLLSWLFHSRFPIKQHAKKYLFFWGVSVLIYIVLSNDVNHTRNADIILRIFQWAALLIVVAHGIYLSRSYYKDVDMNARPAKNTTLYIGILYTILLVVTTNNLLSQLALPDEANAGLSIALGIAGFVQMMLGMRLHLKTLRMLSLVTFGVVLFKLVIIDLWLMPTIGKIIVFIILGIFLLVLSFLYQKLKTVLFDDDDKKEAEERTGSS